MAILESRTQTAALRKPPAREAARRAEGPPAVRLRVLSYNILCGRRWDETRSLIRAHPADIVCLQEVPEDKHPGHGVTPYSQIVADMEMAHGGAMLWNRAPRRIGNVTFVRGSILREEVLTVPLSDPYGYGAEVEVDGARLTVANLHLTQMYGPPPVAFPVTELLRLRETQDLTRRFGGTALRSVAPVVALGDFNSFWPAPAIWYMRRHWHDCRREVGGRQPATRPTYGLPFVIDHIFVRGEVRVRDYRVLPGGGSDHRAVWATIEVAPV